MNPFSGQFAKATVTTPCSWPNRKSHLAVSHRQKLTHTHMTQRHRDTHIVKQPHVLCACALGLIAAQTASTEKPQWKTPGKCHPCRRKIKGWQCNGESFRNAFQFILIIISHDNLICATRRMRNVRQCAFQDIAYVCMYVYDVCACMHVCMYVRTSVWISRCTCHLHMPNAKCRMCKWRMAKTNSWVVFLTFSITPAHAFSLQHSGISSIRFLSPLQPSCSSALSLPIPSHHIPYSTIITLPFRHPVAICMPSTRRWHRFLDSKSEPATEPPLESGQGLGQKLKAEGTALKAQGSRSCRIKRSHVCVPVDWRWSGLVMNCQQIAELELNFNWPFALAISHKALNINFIRFLFKVSV